MVIGEDSDTLYSVSQDTSLKIYSLAEKKQIRSTNLCGLALSSIQLTSDQKTVIIGSWDNSMSVFSFLFFSAFSHFCWIC
jgi:factor associated with neutral sphingomyelinase activation